jgi:hypothetical protein
MKIASMSVTLLDNAITRGIISIAERKDGTARGT